MISRTLQISYQCTVALRISFSVSAMTENDNKHTQNAPLTNQIQHLS